MDGYGDFESYVMIDSHGRDTVAWPDTGVFAFALDAPLTRCKRFDLVQANVPNILYNVTTENNNLFVRHFEYGREFFLDVRLSTGHYDVYRFVDEVTRLLNERLDTRYREADIGTENVVRLTRDLGGAYEEGLLLVIHRIQDDGSAQVHDDQGEVVLTIDADDYDTVDSLGRYACSFLEKKGRMVLRFSLRSVDVHFTLILARPIGAEEKQFYVANGITPAKLRATPFVIMGFDPSINYSSKHTKKLGYDPTLIGLTGQDIDTLDLESLDMIMSTKYMQIFVEPYIYLHILELVMDPGAVPTSWGADGAAFKTIHTTDPKSPSYGKILYEPLAKIIIDNHPGEVVIYNESQYPNTKGVLGFIPPGSLKDVDRLTLVWTRKDGTILNFNKIDLIFLIRVVHSSLPFDETV